MQGSWTAFTVMAKPAGSHCNHRCEYCFYRDKGVLFPQSDAQPRMSREVLRAYVQQLIESQPAGAEVRFIWQGGEPLLCGLDFFQEAIALQKEFANGHPISNALQTNGSLITEAWAQFFRENHFLIGLSLDGSERLHNRYRHANSVHENAWGQAMNGLHCLKQSGCDYNVLVTVNRTNQNYPEEVYDFLRAEGVQFMQLIPIVERQPADGSARLMASSEQGAWKVAPWSVTPKEFGNFLVRFFARWKREEESMRPMVQIFEAVAASLLGLPAPICTFATLCGQTPILEKNGDLFCCDHYVEKDFRLGNILETPIQKLVLSNRLTQFSRLKSDLPLRCKKCSIKNFCQGDCPKHRIENGISYLCKSYRYFFQNVANDIAEILRERS